MADKHGFLDTIKHLAFEDEPEKTITNATPGAPAAASAVLATEAASAAAPVTPMKPIDVGVVPDNNEAYRKILSKTDFEGTDVAATIHKYLEPLKAIPDTVMPANVKFKTAVLQAKAQSGLTEEGILAAFDTLKSRLQQEQNSFDEKEKQFVAREITGRQDRIKQITGQITQLQQELAQLSNELVEAEGKSTHAQGQFAAASQRRAGEIEQQKAQYAALLKG